jgi:hypothetical protein
MSFLLFCATSRRPRIPAPQTVFLTTSVVLIVHFYYIASTAACQMLSSYSGGPETAKFCARFYVSYVLMWVCTSMTLATAVLQVGSLQSGKLIYNEERGCVSPTQCNELREPPHSFCFCYCHLYLVKYAFKPKTRFLTLTHTPFTGFAVRQEPPPPRPRRHSRSLSAGRSIHLMGGCHGHIH